MTDGPKPALSVERFGSVKTEPVLERAFRGGHKTGSIFSVAMVPSRQQCISAGEDGTILIWNFKPQMRPMRLTGHTGPVFSVAASPSGSRLASASLDRTVMIWENANKPAERPAVIKGHAGGVRSVQWSADERLLLTSSDDKTAKLWSLTDGNKFLATFTGHTNWVRSAAFSGDQHSMVSCGDDKSVRIWSTETRKQVHAFFDQTEVVMAAQFHPTEASVVAGAGADRSICLWDCRQQSPLLQTYKDAHESSVTSLAFHSSGYYLVSTGKDGLAKLWDLREGRLLWSAQAHAGAINSVSLDAEGHTMATGGADQTVLIWRTHIASHTRPQPLAPSAVANQVQPASPQAVSPVKTPRATIHQAAPVGIGNQLSAILTTLQSLDKRMQTAEARLSQLEGKN